MSCEIKILSHASLLVKTESSSIVIDPWLVGSCYWRSWWNFPKPAFTESDLEHVDAVVISHVHWDHWHGPTLKKYFKGKAVVTSEDPNLRSEHDLRSMEFNDITRLSHAKSLNIGDIKVTFYNFGLFLTDSAIVIEAGGTTILNANDAKIAGWPLKKILRDHGPIDFALRSHSSANTRVCYEIPGDKSFVSDDREHYFRSFKLFMDVVKPKFAVPFASNHCHLNDDVIKFNSYISNPIELMDYVEALNSELDWNLKVMLPGSSWSSNCGFSFADEACFSDSENYIKKYLEDVYGAGNYHLWLGMRIDEPKRLNKKEGFSYLADISDFEKKDVLDWWAKMPFDLKIKEHLGNCVFCIKKGVNKIRTVNNSSLPISIKKDAHHFAAVGKAP